MRVGGMGAAGNGALGPVKMSKRGPMVDAFAPALAFCAGALRWTAT